MYSLVSTAYPLLLVLTSGLTLAAPIPQQCSTSPQCSLIRSATTNVAHSSPDLQNHQSLLEQVMHHNHLIKRSALPRGGGGRGGGGGGGGGKGSGGKGSGGRGAGGGAVGKGSGGGGGGERGGDAGGGGKGGRGSGGGGGGGRGGGGVGKGSSSGKSAPRPPPPPPGANPPHQHRSVGQKIQDHAQNFAHKARSDFEGAEKGIRKVGAFVTKVWSKAQKALAPIVGKIPVIGKPLRAAMGAESMVLDKVSKGLEGANGDGSGSFKKAFVDGMAGLGAKKDKNGKWRPDAKAIVGTVRNLAG